METKEIKQEDFKSGIDFDSLNFSNSEFSERHPGLSCIPKQVALVFSNYEDQVRFLRMYFKHFGIDVSTIDDTHLMVLVKTVARMEKVASYANGYNDCMSALNEGPSFHDRLVEFFNGIAEEMEDDPFITWTDFIPEESKIGFRSTYHLSVDSL
jgi:hypothetical protein